MSGGCFTVFGADGFVGARLMRRLQAMGAQAKGATRTSWPEAGERLGHAIYAVGLTADFRTRPFATVEAHVSGLSQTLEAGGFDSFLYLSSTRVYRGAAATAEDTPLVLSPTDPDRLYDLSKLCGEALCLAQADPAVRVARLSNVFGDGEGADNFLGSVIAEAKTAGVVRLGQGLASAKDYVGIEDVCTALIAIARGGRQRLYNVASGVNTSHGEIAAAVTAASRARIDVAEGAACVAHQPIDVTRLSSEIPWRPASVLDHVRAALSDPR